MKSVLLLLFLFSQDLWAKTLVISDVDDTLKMTHVHADLLEKMANASTPEFVFTGLPEIFSALEANHAVIYYVSATVAPFDGFAVDFLDFNSFPQRENFYYKGWFQQTKDYKERTIKEIIAYENPDEIILLGDNGEYDPSAYQEIVKLYPRVHSYIHKLYEEEGAVIPAEQSLFLTGADLALQLFKDNFLNEEQTITAVSAVYSALNVENGVVLAPWAEYSDQDVERVFSERGILPAVENEILAIEDYVRNF